MSQLVSKSQYEKTDPVPGEGAVPAPAASVPNPAPTQVLLVVEHDEALRAQASALLRDRSFPVLEARDEEDALELISEGRELIAAAMLDTGLPVKMSLQIARELRGAHPGIKLILVSDGERESIPEPLAAMDGWIYLRKPYGTADLLTAVQRALPRAITAA